MTSVLEVAANATTAVSILLAARNSVHTWWTGIAGCALFALLFHRTQLYADVALQLFFVATSVLGWWQWLRGGQDAPLPITRAPTGMFVWMLPLAAVCTAAYGALLHAYTDAYAPFVDAAVLSLSIAAQLLLMRRRLQTWWFWLAVNSIAVPLYASRGLSLTALLYAGYWVNAMLALRHWRRLAEAAPDTRAAPAACA